MNEKDIEKKVSEGYIYARSIIEVVGKPKEYVEQTLKDYIKKIKKDKTQIITKETIEPAVKQDNFFSTFAELEVLFKDVMSLLGFCFDYMPSSIEIIEPERMIVENVTLTDFLNDLQARLHALNTGFLEMKEQNRIYIKNTAVLLRNFIVVLLTARPMNLKQMKPYLGIKEDDIEKVLNVLIKEGKVIKKDDKYYIKK